MSNIESQNTADKQIEELKEEVNTLQDIIVDQVCDDLLEKFEDQRKDELIDKLTKAKKYKNWVIIDKFFLTLSKKEISDANLYWLYQELKDSFS